MVGYISMIVYLMWRVILRWAGSEPGGAGARPRVG